MLLLMTMMMMMTTSLSAHLSVCLFVSIFLLFLSLFLSPFHFITGASVSLRHSDVSVNIPANIKTQTDKCIIIIIICLSVRPSTYLSIYIFLASF
jgi:hypothetical protein